MFATFLQWFGVYLFLGMLASLVNIREPIDLLKDFDDDNFREFCTNFVVLLFGWPIVLPMLGYLVVVDRIVRRFEYGLNKSFDKQKSLLFFLEAMEIIKDA